MSFMTLVVRSITEAAGNSIALLLTELIRRNQLKSCEVHVQISLNSTERIVVSSFNRNEDRLNLG